MTYLYHRIKPTQHSANKCSSLNKCSTPLESGGILCICVFLFTTLSWRQRGAYLAYLCRNAKLQLEMITVSVEIKKVSSRNLSVLNGFHRLSSHLNYMGQPRPSLPHVVCLFFLSSLKSLTFRAVWIKPVIQVTVTSLALLLQLGKITTVA